MWKYKIQKHFIKDEIELVKIMNEIGKDKWEIFSLSSYNKRQYKDNNDFLHFETEYTFYMKKFVK